VLIWSRYKASERDVKRVADSIEQAYFARIEEVNINGPGLRAVIETNPFALVKAAELDEERRTKGKRSELHGIPVLVKVSFQWFCVHDSD
jgi:Asp-tRNA(Asn)/Glu-tRNA(Gln) amidotransferase A subunit family amidase